MSEVKTKSITAAGTKRQQQDSKVGRDYDRGIKRVIGVIREVDSKQNGKLYVFVDIPTVKGGLRPFGQDKTPVVITDSPLDILLRFGGIKAGQIVEVFYRGIGETGAASAHIIGDDMSTLSNAQEIPREGFSIAASLPFEPMGIF